jgi:hypothetical protein
MTDADLDRDVRLHVFRRAAETAAVPQPAAIAESLGVAREAVDASLLRLAAARVLVLAPGTTTVWMANPFSAAAPTGATASGTRSASPRSSVMTRGWSRAAPTAATR